MKHKFTLRLSAVLLIFIIPVLNIHAADTGPDQIMLADVPFAYGEEAFIRRIEAKADGREPVGLVLSGGSARAFAHIGVLKHLEELGIVPDYIIANSMGSIVGLLYGAGFSPDQITEIILSTDIAELFKVAAPVKGGIIDVSRFSGLLNGFVGDVDISELPIPVMVLCEDLKTKRQIRLTEGDFMTVMRAAYALPVYFDPVVFKDHLLIDGGIANLVPLDTAYDYSSTVIASTTFYNNPKLNLRNPITNINVALDIGKSRTGVSQLKEFDPVLIRCNVESFSFMEFGSLREIQAAGYESACAVSDELSKINGSPVTEELTALRRELDVRIEDAVEAYKPLESISVIDPTLLVTAGLGIYNVPGSERFYNTDLHLLLGLDFTYGTFGLKASAGAGFDLADPFGLFPVADIDATVDLTDSVRLSSEYTVRFDSDIISDFSEAESFFSSSDLYAGLLWVPVAAERIRLGVTGSGEIAFDGLSDPSETLISIGADFSAETEPLSEVNYQMFFLSGLQFPDADGAFSFNDPEVYGDLDLKLPVPGTEGTLRFDLRGFIRYDLSGGDVNYYLRDGMRSSIDAGEYSNVNFASADLVFNPYDFRPAFAEVFMFKEVELSAFGEAGLFDEFVWSSGLVLDFDLSLIGLKPVTLSAYGAWDSLSGGLTGGFYIIP